MIPLDVCRSLLENHDKMTDEELIKLRGSMYELAELALGVYFEKKRRSDTLRV